MNSKDSYGRRALFQKYLLLIFTEIILFTVSVVILLINMIILPLTTWGFQKSSEERGWAYAKTLGCFVFVKRPINVNIFNLVFNELLGDIRN